MSLADQISAALKKRDYRTPTEVCGLEIAWDIIESYIDQAIHGAVTSQNLKGSISNLTDREIENFRKTNTGDHAE